MPQEKDDTDAKEKDCGGDKADGKGRVLMRGAGGALGEEVRTAQGTEKGTVEQERQRGIEDALEQVKRQNERQKHCGDVASRRAHIERREQIIPKEHDARAEHDTERQAENRTRERVLFAVDRGGGTGEGGGADDVHDHADPSGRTDGYHLQKGHDKGYSERGERAVEKAADHNDDIFRLVFQKFDRGDGNARDGHDDIRQCAKHG